MTAGSATAPGFRQLKVEGDFPDSELRSFLVDQFRAVGRMGRMAYETGAPFPTVYDVNVVEIAVTVAESGVYSGVRVSKEIFFMALQAEIISPFLVRSIEGVRVIPPQYTDKVRAVRIVAGGASPLLYWSVKVLFSL